MERERTFLGRLASRGRQDRDSPNTAEDVQALMDSVRRHLTHLLNARHGMSEALDDYGLPAMVDMMAGSGDHARQIGNAIKTAIEKYEPRLRHVRVNLKREESTESHQSLLFRIEATLVGRKQEHRVWYETALRGSGTFDVIG